MTKSILYPFRSVQLAEEIGIHLGDGGMAMRRDNWGVHYDYTLSGHTFDDGPYSIHVKSLMKTLYGLEPSHQRSKGNKLHIHYTSKKLIYFKKSLNLPLGKKLVLKIPDWIHSNPAFIRSFLRGVFDTDGTLTFKSKTNSLHNYPYISITSIDKNFILRIAEMLKKNGLEMSVFPRVSKRKDDPTVSHQLAIGISGDENLQRFLRTIGFNNEKHLSKYRIYKKFGFCPVKTTLGERQKILRDELDPYLIERKNVGGQI